MDSGVEVILLIVPRTLHELSPVICRAPVTLSSQASRYTETAWGLPTKTLKTLKRCVDWEGHSKRTHPDWEGHSKKTHPTGKDTARRHTPTGKDTTRGHTPTGKDNTPRDHCCFVDPDGELGQPDPAQF